MEYIKRIISCNFKFDYTDYGELDSGEFFSWLVVLNKDNPSQQMNPLLGKYNFNN